MRTVAVFSALILLSVCTPASSQDSAGSIKIAVIDMQKVILESSLGKSMQGRVDGFVQSKMSELQKEQQALKREEADLENQRSVLSAEAYTKRRNDLEQKALTFKQKSEAADREYKALYQEEMRKFIEKAAPVIETFGKEGGYTMIVDRNDQGLLFYDKALDITDMVLQKLDAATAGQ